MPKNKDIALAMCMIHLFYICSVLYTMLIQYSEEVSAHTDAVCNGLSGEFYTNTDIEINTKLP